MVGIYAIENKQNGKLYIGSSVNIENRFSSHLSKLRNGKHDNDYLQKAWNKYGEAYFDFVILELSNTDELLFREQFWIDLLNVCDENTGYNLAPTAGSTLGFRHSDETKSKLAEMKIGTKMSPLAKRRMRSGQLGRTHSEATKNKIGSSRKGAKHPLSKLTWEEVREIRSKAGEGISQIELASIYKISREQIGKIVRHERWKE